MLGLGATGEGSALGRWLQVLWLWHLYLPSMSLTELRAAWEKSESSEGDVVGRSPAGQTLLGPAVSARHFPALIALLRPGWMKWTLQPQIP